MVQLRLLDGVLVGAGRLVVGQEVLEIRGRGFGNEVDGARGGDHAECKVSVAGPDYVDEVGLKIRVVMVNEEC